MDERILNDLKESYGLEGRRFSRVNGGFMNALWCVETENGAVLVKVFSAKRFQGKKLDDIERALLLQKSCMQWACAVRECTERQCAEWMRRRRIW